MFVKKQKTKKLSPWHGDIREKGQRDHKDQCIHVCVYRNVKTVSWQQPFHTLLSPEKYVALVSCQTR